MGRMLVAGVMVAAALAAGPACRNKARTIDPIANAMKADIMVDDTAKIAMIVPKRIAAGIDTTQKKAELGLMPGSSSGVKLVEKRGLPEKKPVIPVY